MLPLHTWMDAFAFLHRVMSQSRSPRSQRYTQMLSLVARRTLFVHPRRTFAVLPLCPEINAPRNANTHGSYVRLSLRHQLHKHPHVTSRCTACPSILSFRHHTLPCHVCVGCPSFSPFPNKHVHHHHQQQQQQHIRPWWRWDAAVATRGCVPRVPRIADVRWRCGRACRGGSRGRTTACLVVAMA